MNAERELIEQIECDDLGWALMRVCNLLISLEKTRPFEVLRAMWRAQYIALTDAAGHHLPSWRCEEVLRLEDTSTAINVVSTKIGLASVYGG